MALSFNTTQSKRDIASLKRDNSGIKKTTNTPTQSVSASDFIREEENNVKKIDKEKLLNYFKGRSDARTAIAKGTLSSGNKAQDAWETRMGKLVDLYLDASSREVDDNGNQVFTTDKIIEASKNPSKVVKDMKSFYQSIAPDRVWAIDDYIQKGGMASNVFDYLEGVGGVDNPYGKIEIKGNIFDENTPEAAKGVTAFGSFIPSRGANIAGKIMGNDWVMDNTYYTDKPMWKDTNDAEYKQYISGKLPEGNDVNNKNYAGHSKAEFYDSYSQAKKDGFIGNVDEYRNYKENIDKATMKAQANRLKEGVLTEDDIESSKSAIAGDALAEFITYLSIPLPKAFKVSENPLVNEISNIVVDSLINTAEIVGIEDLKGNKMSSGEIGWTEGVNLLVSGLTRSPVIAKYLRDVKNSEVKKGLSDWIAKVPERVKDAYDRLSVDQLKNIKNLTKQNSTQSSLAKANEGIKYFGKQGVESVDKSFGAYLKAGEDLGKEAQNLKGSGITKELFENEMNKSLKKLENSDYMGNVKWGEGQAPQIHIVETSAGPEIHITNKENLNMVKNGKGEGLGDAIEDIFYGMFGKGNNKAGAGMEMNEASLLAFSNEVKGATQGTEWSWGNQGAKVFGDGLDAFRNESKLPESYLTKEKDYFNKRDLYNSLSDVFDNYGKYSSEIDKQIKLFNAGKKLQDKNLQGVLELAQEAGYISDTIDAEIIAYGYMLGLQDEAAARAFFGNVYPSEPGLIEAMLESIRNGIREGTIDKYINSKIAKDNVSNGASQILDRIIERREGYRAADKTIGGAFNIMKNRVNDYQNKNKQNQGNNQQWSFTDEEYADFINSLNYK